MNNRFFAHSFLASAALAFSLLFSSVNAASNTSSTPLEIENQLATSADNNKACHARALEYLRTKLNAPKNWYNNLINEDRELINISIAAITASVCELGMANLAKNHFDKVALSILPAMQIIPLGILLYNRFVKSKKYYKWLYKAKLCALHGIIISR